MQYPNIKKVKVKNTKLCIELSFKLDRNKFFEEMKKCGSKSDNESNQLLRKCIEENYSKAEDLLNNEEYKKLAEASYNFRGNNLSERVI